MDHYDVIRTRPGVTKDGKPFDWYVKEKLGSGDLRLEEVAADVTGTPRTMEVYRAVRKGNLIAF